MLKKEYFSKPSSTGYTKEEAVAKLEKVKDTLGGPNSKYKDFRIEDDPKGGYRVVAYYESERDFER